MGTVSDDTHRTTPPAVAVARPPAADRVPGPHGAHVARLSVAPTEITRPESGEAPRVVSEPDVPWVTVVHNDPVNLMSYVTYVFQTYFGYPKEKARKLMMDVHHKGRAVVSSGTREEMERDVQAMHGYGLWATLQQDR
ncbi:ATP-dependent Clp protease adaptor protein ClpS [Streptomyces radiopugnans]|jgi:ATP-dependent Clp protease adaptor protein ClpS|uniref:ATP-dependent Clp protease adapter protein ClpS n=1 Tax=Streptomyces radiopugnans TaxID=403935 RepID=A0A1H8YUU4_9ACTN|nr:ATP-dependent Clp protease adaptor protein ClpS [Streptomyces radiopugnans]